jgi:hypothetical protein
VPGVGEKRDRVAEDPIDDFDDHKTEVERDADRESGAEMSGRMDMTAAVIVVMAVMLMGVTLRVAHHIPFSRLSR